MNDNSILVSIICTTYNHEQYISKAIEGFLMQKTNFTYEIIIHDDASTDKTAEIVKQYELLNPNLFFNVYQAENKYSKLGNGIWSEILFPKARGKYIAICEGDDYWLDPQKLQKQFDFMEANLSFSFCFHNAITFYVDKGIQVDFNSHFVPKRYRTIDLLTKKWFIPTASLFIQKKMLPSRFPRWYSKIYSGDLGLELLLSINGDFYGINDKMCVYRKNSLNSLSTNQVNPYKHLQERIILFKNFAKLQTIKIKTYVTFAIFATQFEIIRAKIYITMPWVVAIKDKLRK